MDISKTYIKMCDCEEIQGSWKSNARYPEYEGSCYVSDGDKISYVDYEFPYHESSGTPEETIWLPLQHQIQEWLKLPYVDSHIRLLQELSAFPYKDKSETFEQLWLSFYMYKTYGFIWDGNEWVGESID